MKEKTCENINKDEKVYIQTDNCDNIERGQGKRQVSESRLKIETKSKNVIWGSPWEHGKIG